MHSQNSSAKEIARSSDRNFGLIMAAFFLIIALFPLMDHRAIRYWALVLSILFFGPAIIYPKVLSKLNIIWMQFGELLSKIVSPIALGLVFFFAITPFALVMRLIGKQTLDLRFEDKANSYWKIRRPPGPDPKSMKDQF